MKLTNWFSLVNLSPPWKFNFLCLFHLLLSINFLQWSICVYFNCLSYHITQEYFSNWCDLIYITLTKWSYLKVISLRWIVSRGDLMILWFKWPMVRIHFTQHNALTCKRVTLLHWSYTSYDRGSDLRRHTFSYPLSRKIFKPNHTLEISEAFTSTN